MDGTGLRRITDDAVAERWYTWSPDWDEGHPDWPPDGWRIAFNGVRQEAGKQFPEVFLIAPDGTGLQMLVTAEDPNGSYLESENPWRAEK
jgi:hypothetical protein